MPISFRTRRYFPETEYSATLIDGALLVCGFQNAWEAAALESRVLILTHPDGAIGRKAETPA